MAEPVVEQRTQIDNTNIILENNNNQGNRNSNIYNPVTHNNYSNNDNNSGNNYFESNNNSNNNNVNVNNNQTNSDDITGKIFVGGLSWDTTEQSMRYHFERYGELAEVSIMMNKLNGQPRGFGFIKMKDSSAADIVCSQEHTIDGKVVDVKFAVARENAPAPTRSESRKIFVGGLPPECTEKDFAEYFRKFGVVKDVVIMIERETGRSRGFGFVTFENDEVIEEILRTENEIMGKWCEVKRAEPRDGRGSNPTVNVSGGRGGGGRGYNMGGGYGGQHQGGYGGQHQGGYGGYGQYQGGRGGGGRGGGRDGYGGYQGGGYQGGGYQGGGYQGGGYQGGGYQVGGYQGGGGGNGGYQGTVAPPSYPSYAPYGAAASAPTSYQGISTNPPVSTGYGYVTPASSGAYGSTQSSYSGGRGNAGVSSSNNSGYGAYRGNNSVQGRADRSYKPY